MSVYRLPVHETEWYGMEWNARQCNAMQWNGIERRKVMEGNGRERRTTGIEKLAAKP